MSVLFKTSYGLDISDDHHVAIRCTRRGKRLICKPAAPENCKEISSDSVQACIVRIQNSLTCRLEAPVKSGRKARMVLPSLLDMQLPFPLETCVFEFTAFSRNPDGSSSALAVAIPKKSLASEIEACRQAGFDPELLDHEGTALLEGALPEIPELASEYKAVIRLRNNGQHAVATGKNKLFINSHSLSGIKPEKKEETIQELATAINQTLFADIPENAGTSWFFCGAPANDRELAEKLHVLLAKTRPGPMTIPENPETFLARALAKRAVSDAPGLNLRKNEFTHTRLAAAVKKRLNRSFAILLAAGLALLIASLSWQIKLEQRRRTVPAKITRLAEILVPDSAIQYGQEVFQAEHAVREKSKMLAPVFALFERSITSDLNTIISESKHYNVTCSTIVLGKNKLTVAGHASDWDSCRKFREKLNIPGFQLNLTRRESLADAKVYFTITGGSTNER